MLYLGLVAVTVFQVRGLRPEPGVLLRHRAVRRALVCAMAALCALMAATPPPTSGVAGGWLFGMFAVLMVLNVTLGRATQRISTAVDDTVDERQEALRNRAHRIAYLLLGSLAAAAVVCDVVSAPSRHWLTSALGAGGGIAALELLFVLPAMVLAFFEPSRLPLDDEARAWRSARARIAAGLLAATIAIPVVLSIAVLFVPDQVSAWSDAPSDAGAVSSTDCREFYASRTVGVLVTATVPLHALACWNGQRATESFGMNTSDCLLSSADLVILQTTTCRRVTSADGTLTFTYRSRLTPVLLPFVHRDLTLQVRIDRHGTVEEFP